MKKFFRRFGVLFLVFVLGVAGTAILMNSRSTDDRSDMNNPVLPEVMVDFGGTLANLMHGYRGPMQADFVRECVTPLDTTKKLDLVIAPHESEVKSLAYEIRSSDGRKVIENRKINALEEADGYLRTSVEISSGLLMNQEYSMQITLDTDTERSVIIRESCPAQRQRQQNMWLLQKSLPENVWTRLWRMNCLFTWKFQSPEPEILIM